MSHNPKHNPQRRGFLGTVAAAATTIGLANILPPLKLNATSLDINGDTSDLDAWFGTIKGKHRMAFDATKPHGVYPFAWPRVFLMTNELTGTPTKENSVVVVLRHDAIPYAFEDRLWAKYKFGEMFHAMDPKTEKASTRNPFWKPAKGDFKIPGIGDVPIGINELQESGVMFCVCNAAMTVYSAVAADMMKMDAAEVKKDWEAGLLPGVKVVPSGVWALGRAQEHGCGYIFAG